MKIKSVGFDAAITPSYQNQSNSYPATDAKSNPTPNLEGVKAISGNNDEDFSKLQEKKRDGQVLSVGEKVILETIERANKAVQGVSTCFKFSVHKETHEIMVKVLNSETNEVIREIPPEKVLDMVAKMWEMAGIIVDERR